MVYVLDVTYEPVKRGKEAAILVDAELRVRVAEGKVDWAVN